MYIVLKVMDKFDLLFKIHENKNSSHIVHFDFKPEDALYESLLHVLSKYTGNSAIRCEVGRLTLTKLSLFVLNIGILLNLTVLQTKHTSKSIIQTWKVVPTQLVAGHTRIYFTGSNYVWDNPKSIKMSLLYNSLKRRLADQYIQKNNVYKLYGIARETLRI